MSKSDIYSDFKKEIGWITDKHRRESLTFPKSLRYLAEYYMKKRLFILSDKPGRSMRIDPRFGRPVPYLAFWFADAFHLSDREVIKKLALSLSYISLSVSVRDDLLDGRIASEHAHVCLGNLYYDKYFKIFKEIFPSKSNFWYILSNCLDEWANYEKWSFLFRYNNQFDPFSKRFLRASSMYLVAITLPTLAAIAILADNEAKISKITRFLRNYWMGWKIVDDIRDRQKDIFISNFNHSSILYYGLSQVKNKLKFDKEMIISIFLNKDFVNHIYYQIITLYRSARYHTLDFNCSYLTKFMDTQIEFHTDERNDFLRLGSIFDEGLNKLLLASK